MSPPPDVRAVVDAIERAIGPAQRPVHLHEPLFAGREREYVLECIDTGWVSSAGRFVTRFEEMVAERCGAKYGVAVMNGTAALHVALSLSGVRTGDEVIIPTLTFVATANAVAYCGALPHFVDADERTLGVDPEKLRAHLAAIAERHGDELVNRETRRPIRAVMPVHVFGHPVDMDRLKEVCAEFGLPLIEDATEALGSLYKGRPCGGLSFAGVLSFNGNKVVTTGGGGAIVTDDENLAHRAKHLTTTAKQPHAWAFNHDEVGWNYRLPNLNAALGVAQLEQLDTFLAAKRRLAEHYAETFEGLNSVRFVREPEESRSNCWLNALLLEDDSSAVRDAVLQATHDAGLLTRPAWTPMHQLPMFRDAPRGELSTSESLARRLINLPSSVVLGALSGATVDNSAVRHA
jgi:perosamine synthetase